MKNKHKLWIFVGVIFLFAVAIVGFASTQVPSLVITDPNSTSNSSNGVSHSVSKDKSSGTVNQQSNLKNCPTCGGTGSITKTSTNQVTCKACGGNGKTNCTVCGGDGWVCIGYLHGILHFDKCINCVLGKVICATCGGKKTVPETYKETCPTCQGAGKVPA